MIQITKALKNTSNYDLLEEAYGALAVLVTRLVNESSSIANKDEDEIYVLECIIDAVKFIAENSPVIFE